MKSIRLALLVSFLCLLGLALGAVGGFDYWTSKQIISERQAAMAEVLREQFCRRCAREKQKFDNALLYQARTLASLAQFEFQANRHYLPTLEPLGILTAGLAPEGHLLVPAWIAQSTHGPLAARVFRLASLEIRLEEDELPRFPGAHEPVEYFQITTEWGNTWRSNSLENEELNFPVGPDLFTEVGMFASRTDDYELIPGLKVRRVTLKVPMTRIRFLGNPTAIRPPPGSNEAVYRPALLIQAGAQTLVRDAELEKLQAEHEEGLANLAAESAATLAGLRQRLLVIGFAAFAATLGGGFLLVRRGLAPLQRLTDAVSKVSEKDFRLQIDERGLPAELRPIVDRLTQTLTQLQDAFNREKQTTADIAHELRTPLAALLTTAEVGLRKPRPIEEYRQLLQDCRVIGQQLSCQVERLLALARLDAGVDRYRAQSIDVAALADQCADLVRPLARARSLDLAVHHDGPACLTTDADKLREVLTNLLHNAIEYNRPSGRIDVNVKRHNGTLDVEVRDTGIGIAPDVQPHIFQRFYRADPARNGAGVHAGLGLAIVKGYVDLLGGSIGVESVPEQGSTFRIRLPVKEEKAIR